MQGMPGEWDSQPPGGDIKVKKSMQVTLEDQEIIELMRIMLDDDAEGALSFLKNHFRGKARHLLEGSLKVRINVPGTGIQQMRGNLFR